MARLATERFGGVARWSPPVGRNVRSSRPGGFTLIELILVMSILTIALSITAPALANFFRGRTLDSEARRLLALTRHGQSRAVSEGVPVELWIDDQQGTFGLEAEPSFEAEDPRAVECTLDGNVQIEALDTDATMPDATLAATASLPTAWMSTASPATGSRHAGLPRIRFLPDGSISDSSPRSIRLTGRDGVSLWLTQARNRLNYEIHNQAN